MTCERARDLLDSLSRDHLAPADRAELERHLSDCPQCRADAEASVTVASLVQGARREIQPPNDLWTGIAPRLKRGNRRIDLPIWRIAAAALLLMTASSTATWLVVRPAKPAASVPFQSLEADYARVALELSEVYVAAQSAMSPATKAVLAKNLAVIERALSEAREALRSEPNNPAIEAIVTAAYRRKIEFLERATTLDRDT
jgi:predicted anti-sigma-YlaC factor YlaD